jgi:periplasmic protein TonB
MSVPIHPVPRLTRRLIVGLAISLAVHLLFVFGFTPRPARIVAPQPLQVEIRREAPPQPAAEIAAEQPSELLAEPAAVTPPPQAVPPEPPPRAPAAPEAPIEINLPLEKYYNARELDVRAEPINEVDLIYPQRAYQMRIKGKVILRIFINEHGAIDEVAVLEATPPGVFEEAALTATLALQFKPAIKNGRNVKSQKTIHVDFDPYESINIP